ncbi:MAG: hypothetical protein J6A79_14965 [Clostridia bacterium]|nr:hypothetical protein [Clostridia bacterium]
MNSLKEAAAKRKRNAILTLLLAAAAVASYFIATKIVIPEQNYNQAKYLLSSGKYADAYTAFIGMQGYKDVDTLLKTDQNLLAAAAAREAKLKSCKTVGSTVTFGTYPQTSGGADNTPIEWIVLDTDGKKSLLISKYALDTKPYNTSYKAVTWETCTLRSWLNKDFLGKAFSSAEQGAILTTNVDNSKAQGNSGYSTSGGNNTQDKVFLLSYAEAGKYFKDDNARKCAPTDYAIKQGAYTNLSDRADGRATGWWWLRSPGRRRYSAASVYFDGSRLNGVYNTDSVVRPAFWLNLESGIF